MNADLTSKYLEIVCCNHSQKDQYAAYNDHCQNSLNEIQELNKNTINDVIGEALNGIKSNIQIIRVRVHALNTGVKS